MPGGSTCAMHRVTLHRPTRGPGVVVLRRYVLDDVLVETPDIVAHEAAALRLAATAGTPVPELLAVDPDGHEAGAPAVVMSWLDGAARVGAARRSAVPGRDRRRHGRHRRRRGPRQ